MNQKSALFIILALILSLATTAREVTFHEAEEVARHAMFQKLNSFGEGIELDNLRIINSSIKEVDGMAVYYVFNFEQGFMLISGDDAYVPVMGYSFQGNFTLDNAPESFRSFIRSYEDQILFIRKNNIVADEATTTEWEFLLSEESVAVYPERDGRDVEPLLNNNWNQDSPYNILCPEDPAGPGGHTYVGCVATAMSMIMYYWRYPETGEGQHCYVPGNMSYGQQCAYFGSTNYQWEGMTNSIDSKNPFPNAELQFHAAVSVNMNFSPNGSGSYSYLVPERLDAFFRYHDAQYLEKSSFQQSAWISLLKAEIDLGRPLYYSGYDNSGGGHAFVCDGYQGDNFHFNFGWSGSGNGYYALNNVGGFYNGQGCIRYFYPSENYPNPNTGSRTITHRSGSITDGSGPVDDYLDNLNASWLIDPQADGDSISTVKITFAEFDVEAGDTLKIFAGETTEGELLAAFSGETVPTTMITAQSNKMLVTFTTDGSSTAGGWYAEFNTTSPIWCSGLTNFTEPEGTFDDGSGEYNYVGSSTCMWKIEPEWANKIIINFNSFETEENADKVKIFDGSTQVAEFSGTEIPESVECTSGSAFITFTSNQFNNMQGWEIYYTTDNVGAEELQAASFKLYPNPADDRLNIYFDQDGSSETRIEIMDLTGKIVYKDVIGQFSGAYYNSIDVSDLPGGLYLVRISTGKETVNKKFIKE